MVDSTNLSFACPLRSIALIFTPKTGKDSKYSFSVYPSQTMRIVLLIGIQSNLYPLGSDFLFQALLLSVTFVAFVLLGIIQKLLS
jgi:hypothetical protein